MFDREFVQAKLHLDVLRRELETVSLGRDSQVTGKKLDELEPRYKNAYYAFLYASVGTETEPQRLTDRAAWDWLRENGIDTDEPGMSGFVNWKLPTYDTWETYLVKARSALGENKHYPRGGRKLGKSVVGAKDLDLPYREDK
jgi:hypothetical protein